MLNMKCKLCGNDDIFKIDIYDEFNGINKKEFEFLLKKCISPFDHIVTVRCLVCEGKYFDIYNKREFLEELIQRFNNGETRGFCSHCKFCHELDDEVKKETNEQYECINPNGIWYNDFILSSYYFYVHNSKCWTKK